MFSCSKQVVTEPTPLKGDYLAVNNISAAGDFGHVIIKKNPKTKKRQPQVGVLPPDGIPRLVLLSGRVEIGLANIMKTVPYSLVMFCFKSDCKIESFYLLWF